VTFVLCHNLSYELGPDEEERHARVQLKPTPHRLDDYGRKLPPLNDDWIIEEVSADGVRIKNLRTHHTTTLGKDHICDYISNPNLTGPERYSTALQLQQC
jgi:hypothetical protein